MKRLWVELNLLLEKKISLFDDFILLLEEQWDSITRYSLASFDEIAEKKEKLVQDLNHQEKQRQKLIDKIAASRGVSPEGIRLKSLIQSQQGPLRDNLEKNRETLLGQIRVINDLNSKIKRLLDQSSLSLKKSLVFIHQAAEQAASPYGATGKVSEGKLKSRMLSTDI